MRAMVLTADDSLVTSDSLCALVRYGGAYALMPSDDGEDSERAVGVPLAIEAGQSEVLAVELGTEGQLNAPTTPRGEDPADYDFGRPEIRHTEGATYLLNACALVHDAYWDTYWELNGGTGYSDLPADLSSIRGQVNSTEMVYCASFNSAWTSESLPGIPERVAAYTDAQHGDRIEPSAETHDRVSFALESP